MTDKAPWFCNNGSVEYVGIAPTIGNDVGAALDEKGVHAESLADLMEGL